MSNRLLAFAKLMRLHRPIGIGLLLWPTLWALWIASSGHPNLLVLSVFIAGVVIMRSAGCVINDIADRHIDGRVKRTQDRPLVTGEVSLKEAIVLFISLCLLAFLLVLLLNALTIQFAFIAVILGSLYPFSKRYIQTPQVVLGIAWNMAIPMAFAAVTNNVPAIAWWLYLSAITWTIVYDTFYAMADRPYDQLIGVKSTAILFGAYDLTIIAILQIITLGLWTGVGLLCGLNAYYFIAVVIAAGFFIYHDYSASHRDPSVCFKMFLNNNYVGMILFIGLYLAYI